VLGDILMIEGDNIVDFENEREIIVEHYKKRYPEAFSITEKFTKEQYIECPKVEYVRRE